MPAPDTFTCPACESECKLAGANVCDCCWKLLCYECYERHQQIAAIPANILEVENA